MRAQYEQDIGVFVENEAGDVVSLESSFGLKYADKWKTAAFEFTALESNDNSILKVQPETIAQYFYADNFKLIDLTLERKAYRVMRIQGSMLPGSFVQTLTLREKTDAETA